MNANTIAQVSGLTLGNVTSESAFPATAGGSIRAVVSVERATAWGTVSGVLGEAQLPQSVVDGHPFKVKAAFKVTGGTSGNFTGKIYANLGGNTNLTTFSSDVSTVSSSTLATGGANAISLYLETICFWDSASGRLMGANGLCFSNIASVAILNSGAFTLTNTTTPIGTSLATSDKLAFFATGLFGTGNAGNSVTLTELSIELY